MQISKKILRVVGQSNAKYKFFEENDKILLALSGGKDSMVLFHILKYFSSVSPINWEFTPAIVTYSIDQDVNDLEDYIKNFGSELVIIKSDIYNIGLDKLRKNSSFCSFCSRMRRGNLYTYAINNGFNKIALAHHFDDAVQSFFMNFSFNGVLRTLPPIYTANNNLKIIRPLILLRERQIIDCAKNNEIFILKDDNCPAKKYDEKKPTAREDAKELLKKLESDNPKLFISLKSAFERIHIDSFFGQ